MKLTQLSEMLALQDKLNSRVDPLWRTRGNNWTRAIIVEGAEALDHYGWKWWKKQEPNLPQVRLELVDIWHFIMSYAIERFPSPADYIANSVLITTDKLEYLMGNDVRVNFEQLIGAAAEGDIAFSVFVALMHQTGLTWGKLYETYVGQNVLNMFRQDHGYKEGTYIKDWNGQEDNEVLTELVETAWELDAMTLYGRLESVYASLPRLRAVA